MTKLILTFIISVSSSLCIGQITNADLSKINTVAQAKRFIQKNPAADGKLLTIQSSQDSSDLFLSFYNKQIGYTVSIGDINYKVLETDSTLSFRASYIYLDGKQLSKKTIDSVRQEIITKYKAGTSFTYLAQQYNMDGNINGDTNWFPENVMVKEFEIAVRKHKQGDIFTVDTPAQKWYHIILKTHDDTYIKKVTLISTKSNTQ